MTSRVNLKVVVLGKKYGGKTSIVKRYIIGKFYSSAPYQNTIGAAFGAKKVVIDGEIVIMGIWDIPDSESMNRMYCRGAEAAIVCYDLTDNSSFDRAKFWVNELRASEKDCSVYLCGTKYDLVQEDKKAREVNASTVERYGDGISAKLIETSSKTGYNIESLFLTIAEGYVKKTKKKVNKEIVMNQDFALLLQNVEGFKEEKLFGIYKRRLKPVAVKKGSLLILLNPSVVNTMKKSYGCNVNYRVEHVVRSMHAFGGNSMIGGEHVFVDSSLLYYLSKHQRNLFLGVINPFDRLELLGQLEWVESLREGSEVYVTIPTVTAPVKGIVRYIGSLPGEEAIKFGVELMEKRGQGTHDGRFKETEFFKCAKDCAVFVGMDKLTDGDTVKAAKVTPKSDPSVVKSMPTDKDGVPIRLGDYVKFYDKLFAKHRGVVRWIGTNKTFLPDGTPIVGIEVETDLNLNDVPLNIKDRFMRDYFASKKSKLFLPITSVYRDKSNSSIAQKPTHDCSVDLSNSPQEGVVKHPQDSDTQLQSLTRRESDTTTEVPSKHKGHHDYETLPDFIPESHNPYNLEVGSAVQYMDFNQYGVIKWIGTISDSRDVYAGIEMEDDVSENGGNGELMGVKYFVCKPGKGKFARLHTLKPDKRNKQNKKLLDDAQPLDPNPCNLEVGSLIEYGDPIQYGMIKWIGQLLGEQGLHAGVEMEDPLIDPTDGMWKGFQYFHSSAGRGKFIPLSQLQPDSRFVYHAAETNQSNSTGINTVVIHQDPTTSGSHTEQSKSNRSNESTDVSFTAGKVHQDMEQKIFAVEGKMKHYIEKSEESIQRMEANVDNAFRKAMEVQSINKELQVNNAGTQQQLLDMQKSNEQLQASNEHLQSQMLTILDKLSHTQQQLLDMQKSNELLRNANTHLQDQLSLAKQQMIDAQKSNDLSQANLQNQLSLTQQQLLGVQSMMTCSRLWVVSHDQFKIGREIGRGAWASVHETTFRGAKVAAKRLHDEITSPETIELFHQEMEMALHCQHQNIVTFLGVTLENHPVILMELMDISLRSAYKRGNVKYEQVLKIFYDIASALHFLHTRPDPVIHRDVSSANVLLKDCGNEKWLAKLGDLGTAKLQQYCTTPGPGALAYAAPEVADPKRHSTKMDVYSFGVLVVEVFTKTLPFQNLNTLKGQVQQQFPQYHQLVTSCTNQQSSDRPTMYDVIGQLNKIL